MLNLRQLMSSRFRKSYKTSFFARLNMPRALRQNIATDETFSHFHTMSTNTVSVTSIP